LPLDIGVTDAARRTPDMPLYTLRNKATGETVQTTDPGRALITGKWRDVARFKGPILRGLAARPPYFHNGLAADLAEVVDFYDTRFAMGMTAQERADLVAFLRAL
jgi:cytochrome c peroxidase